MVDVLRKSRLFGLCWSEVSWLLYCGFWIIGPLEDPRSYRWAVLLVVLALFIPLYLVIHSSRFTMLQRRLGVLAIAILGFVYVPFNVSAFGIYIFIGASLAEIVAPTVYYNIALLAVIAEIAVQAELYNLPAWEWAPAIGITVLIALNVRFFHSEQKANARLRLAQDQIEQLAKTAERERIARDLHDVLGHTLSLIAVKSELAVKLVNAEPEKARDEMAQVGETARRALSEVRKTVSGYRAQGLERELEASNAILVASGIALVRRPETLPPMKPQQEAMYCMVLREAVTNVVRHAAARTVWVELEKLADGTLQLRVRDDGRGFSGSEGNGLAGMRERIREFGGTIAIRAEAIGTVLTASTPGSQAPA